MEKENTKSKGLLLENKPLVITVCTVAAILIVIFIVFLITTPDALGGEASPPERLSGEYSMALESGSSTYVFFEDGTGKLTYSTDSSPMNDSFTYEIRGEGENKTISFTWESTAQKTTHAYSTGSMGSKPFITINDVIYYKK